MHVYVAVYKQWIWFSVKLVTANVCLSCNDLEWLRIALVCDDWVYVVLFWYDTLLCLCLSEDNQKLLIHLSCRLSEKVIDLVLEYRNTCPAFATPMASMALSPEWPHNLTWHTFSSCQSVSWQRNKCVESADIKGSNSITWTKVSAWTQAWTLELGDEPNDVGISPTGQGEPRYAEIRMNPGVLGWLTYVCYNRRVDREFVNSRPVGCRHW